MSEAITASKGRTDVAEIVPLEIHRREPPIYLQRAIVCTYLALKHDVELNSGVKGSHSFFVNKNSSISRVK